MASSPGAAPADPNRLDPRPFGHLQPMGHMDDVTHLALNTLQDKVTVCTKKDAFRVYDVYGQEGLAEVEHIHPDVSPAPPKKERKRGVRRDAPDAHPSELGRFRLCAVQEDTGNYALVAEDGHETYHENEIVFFRKLPGQKKGHTVSHYGLHSRVLSIKMKVGKLMAVCRDRTYVLHPFVKQGDPRDLRPVKFRSRDNPLGLGDITPQSPATSSGCVAEYVALVNYYEPGSVNLVDLGTCKIGVEVLGCRIKAHDHELACMALNDQGSKLATASVNGTLVRVWSTVTKAKLIEVRRGMDPATIYSLCFSHDTDNDWLAATSDKGHGHVWALNRPELNTKSRLAEVVAGKKASPQWSYKKFEIPINCLTLCCFSRNRDRTLMAIGVDGHYQKLVFSEEGRGSPEPEEQEPEVEEPGSPTTSSAAPLPESSPSNMRRVYYQDFLECDFCTWGELEKHLTGRRAPPKSRDGDEDEDDDYKPPVFQLPAPGAKKCKPNKRKRKQLKKQKDEEEEGKENSEKVEKEEKEEKKEALTERSENVEEKEEVGGAAKPEVAASAAAEKPEIAASAAAEKPEIAASAAAEKPEAAMVDMAGSGAEKEDEGGKVKSADEARAEAFEGQLKKLDLGGTEEDEM